MFVVKNWYRCAAPALFVTALALAGCGKKADPTKSETDPKPADVPKGEKKKDGDITADDLRNAAKAAGGDLDAKKPEPPKAPESLAKVKPDVVLTPKELVEEAKKDSLVLITKYAGRVVEVSGRVETLSGVPGSTYVVLRGGEKYGDSPFRCDVNEKNLATKVLPSQTAILRIRCPQSPAGLETANWEIVEVKGTFPTLTANQFLQEWIAAEGDTFREKYHQQHLILTGVISKVETDDRGAHVFLTGEKDTQLDCLFRGKPFEVVAFSQRQKESLKPSQAVKVCGEFSTAAGSLIKCILLEPAP